jgi:hypothetical protein
MEVPQARAATPAEEEDRGLRKTRAGGTLARVGSSVGRHGRGCNPPQMYFIVRASLATGGALPATRAGDTRCGR